MTMNKKLKKTLQCTMCAAAFGYGGGDHYAAGEPEQDPQAV